MTRDLHSDLDRLQDEIAAYSLGALDESETRELEHHLDSCESCRERLRWLRPAVDLLPASVEQLAPPERLRENLLATVRAEAATGAPAPSPAPGPSRRSWWEGLRAVAWRPATAMAVMIVLVVGVAAGYLIRGDAEVSNDFVRAEGIGPQAAQVSATLEHGSGATTLHVSEMPKLGRDEVYAVWVQRGGVMEPRNTFVLGRDGSAEAAVPGPLEGATDLFVTAEPRPGSRQPTTEPVLRAPL